MEQKPAIIITIDTEPDNQWIPGKSISLDNLDYIPRFQSLCEEFSFKPVWLTEYNVALNKAYCDYMKDKVQRGLCEIGLHPHAWTTPPDIQLTDNDLISKPYMTEYPIDIIRKKINTHVGLLRAKFGEILTHRSGRWAINKEYASVLLEYGIKYDCTINPGRIIPPSSPSSTNYCDYSKAKNEVFNLVSFYGLDDAYDELLEIPFTIDAKHPSLRKILPRKIARKVSPVLQFRPNGRNLHSLLTLMNMYHIQKKPYIQFMLHSSELMPGCSPTFQTKDSIEKLYGDLRILFEQTKRWFDGYTIKEFMGNRYKNETKVVS